MAKAKKSETPAAPAAKKPAAKAAAKSKAAAKPAAAPAAPMVDTNLAAQAAARMLTAKAAGGNVAPAGDKKETSTFKQLKQSFTKPHGASMGNMLNSTISNAAKKSNAPFQGNKQVGHNQTFGADVSRNSVPRRTGG
jgi:hypothetical protein